MLKKLWGHFRTVQHHRHLVFKHCRACGLWRQGLTHDLSKFSPEEFITGVRYYQGNRSPNDAERFATGISLAWLHHKGRNKHHLEYWIDYRSTDGLYTGQDMPLPYIMESVCDRMAASKVYLGDRYDDGCPMDYYMHSREHYLLSEQTDNYFLRYLGILQDQGEEALFRTMKAELREYRRAERARKKALRQKRRERRGS